MDFEQAFSQSNIQLEPRLQEYMNRKAFNRENNITPDIPEEQQFSITPEDRKIMKRYSSGKQLYSKSRTDASPHFVKTELCNDDFFTDKDAFKKDPRYKRLQKKMASHKKAQAQIHNLEGIDNDYEIFHRSNPYDDPMNPNVTRPSRISKPYDDPDNYNDEYDLLQHKDRGSEALSGNLRGIYRRDPNNSNDSNYCRNSQNSHDYRSSDSPNSVMMDSRDLVLGNSKGEYNQNKYMYNPNDNRGNPRASESSYNHKPRISFRNSLIPEKVNGGLDHNHTITDIIGNLDDYNHHLEETYDYIEAEVDQDSRTMRPRTRDTTRREQYNGYKTIPYGYGGGLVDIGVENSLRGGIRDSKNKTTGFRNPFEHQFDYIDSDISDPKHTVEMRPVATRGANRVIARPNSIAVNAGQKIKARHDIQYAKEKANQSPFLNAQRRGYADPNRNTDDLRR